MASKPRGPKPSLLFNLGAFVGNVARGFTQPVRAPASAQRAADAPRPPEPRVVRTDVAEKTVDTPAGPVTLRRTVIDEVVPGQVPPSSDESGPPTGRNPR